VHLLFEQAGWVFAAVVLILRQTLPQAPQLLTSLDTRVSQPSSGRRTGLHVMYPSKQPSHLPCLQWWLYVLDPVHDLPQTPQLARSLMRSTQLSPQRVVLSGQSVAAWVVVQLPSTQLPSVQAFPQRPQCSRELFKLAQRSPHAVLPPSLHTQTPSLHVCSGPQTAPQRPQWLLSCSM
jgi:hypothetical protein